MQEVKELWREEIVARWLLKVRRGLGKKKLQQQPGRKRIFSRSEKTYLCVFVFQLLELEEDLQQQRFLPLSILGCG